MKSWKLKILGIPVASSQSDDDLLDRFISNTGGEFQLGFSAEELEYDEDDFEEDDEEYNNSFGFSRPVELA